MKPQLSVGEDEMKRRRAWAWHNPALTHL